MRFGWVALLALWVSLPLRADFRDSVIQGLVLDFNRWNQISPAKLRELHGRKPRAEADRILHKHFESFFDSSANSQRIAQPSTQEIQAALGLLMTESRIPFNARLGKAPKYPPAPKPVLRTVNVRDERRELLRWTFTLPRLTWFLPNPEAVDPDGHGGFIKRKDRKFNRNKEERLREADNRIHFSDENFYFDETQPIAFRLNEPIETAAEFLSVLQLYSHLDSGRVLLDTLTDFAASAGNSVAAIPLLTSPSGFQVHARTEGGVNVPAAHSLRPSPRIWVNFSPTSESGAPQPLQIYFQRGTEFGHLFLDLAYALTHDGPTGAERIALGKDLEGTDEETEEEKPANRSGDPTHFTSPQIQQVWRETSIHAVHAEALFLQHSLFEELSATIHAKLGRETADRVDGYFARLESDGIVPILRRPVTDREINVALDLKSLEERPIDLDNCLARVKDLRTQ